MLVEVVCYYPGIQKTRQHKTKETILCISGWNYSCACHTFSPQEIKKPNSKMLWCVSISSQVPATSFDEMFFDSFLSLQLKLLFCLSTYTTTFYGSTQFFMAHTNIEWTDPLTVHHKGLLQNIPKSLKLFPRLNKSMSPTATLNKLWQTPCSKYGTTETKKTFIIITMPY